MYYVLALALLRLFSAPYVLYINTYTINNHNSARIKHHSYTYEQRGNIYSWWSRGWIWLRNTVPQPFNAIPACCRAASVLPPWNSRCKIELIFGVMLQFNVVWCIHSRREIVLTIQSDNGKQGYKVGGKKYRRPKVVLSQRPLRTVLQRLDSETRGILSSQRALPATSIMVATHDFTPGVFFLF